MNDGVQDGASDGAKGLTTAQTPFLPRGVRLHECVVRQGWFLLAPERALKLDQIGFAILSETDGEASLGDIVTRLVSQYGAPRDQIETDVVRFLEDLIQRGVVEVRQ